MKKILSSEPWIGIKEHDEKQKVMDYLQRWFVAFEKELIKYQGRNPKDCPWWYGERTTLGLFLNAILQEENQEMNFLQEFDSARNNEETRGRGDLLLWNEDICLLFESKKYYTLYKTDGTYYYKKEGKNEFWFVEDVVMKQARKYDMSEYQECLGLESEDINIYLIALCFDTLLYPKKKGGKFENVFDQWKNFKWNINQELDFYKFYHYSQDYDFDNMVEENGNNKRSYLGMAVYGKMEKFNEK